MRDRGMGQEEYRTKQKQWQKENNGILRRD